MRLLKAFYHEKIWKLNEIVKQFSNEPIQKVTLEYLKDMGEARDSVLSAKFVHRELPKRLARRLKALESLPFIVGVNPHIRSVYQLYLESFNAIRGFKEICSRSDQQEFDQMLRDLVRSHQDVVATLAKGFSESGKYMTKQSKTDFLDNMIKARIGIRVVAEHHLALQEPEKDWIGIVHNDFQPARLVKTVASYASSLCEMNYGSCPEVVVDGHVDTSIPYIPVHFEYIAMEVLKNAMRATVEYSNSTNRIGHPDIQVTIARSNQEVVVRIRDEGGGISEENLVKVFDYSFTTVPKYVEDSESVFANHSKMDMQSSVGGPIAGLGFGLPMSRVYAKYFGGSMLLKPVFGHGCDVFIRLPNIATKLHNVQI